LKKLSAEEFHSSELEAFVSKVLNTDHMKQWEDDNTAQQLASATNGVHS
jgi:hypothetical protein